MFSKVIFNPVRRHAYRIGFLLLVSGALIAFANEFFIGNGEVTILGIGGSPSSRGMILIIFGLVLTRLKKRK